jgi:hypothetical protein
MNLDALSYRITCKTNSREHVQRKGPKLWPDKWTLHRDNALAHEALRFHKFLAKKSITNKDHLPYSPDLAPCYFWLFTKLENGLKGQRSADIPDIQCNMTLFQKTVFKTASSNSSIISQRAWLHKESISKVTQPLVHR